MKRKPPSHPWRHWWVLLCPLIACADLQAGPVAPQELPTGAKVVAGQIQVTQEASSLRVQQSSPKAIVDWNSFNVGEQARVEFIQPNASSAILNRVVAGDTSQILGQMSANGQVYLINPQGIYFAKSASVDVGALMATTHQLRNEDFLNDRFPFIRGNANASVVNEGLLKAAPGGFLALVAPQVTNAGTLATRQGTVALVAGDKVELKFANGLVGIVATPATVRAMVDNQQLILAPDGQVILSAKAMDSLLGGVVKNSGSIEANGMVGDGGRVWLTASDTVEHTGRISANAGAHGQGGQVQLLADLTNIHSRTTVDGDISARGGSQSGDGGFVETSASHLNISRARVAVSAPNGKAGTWLLDPQDIVLQNPTVLQASEGTSALDSPSGWTASGGTINANWCFASGCGSSTNAPYIGSSKTGTGVVQFSYLGSASVSRIYPLGNTTTAIDLSISVLAKGAVSGRETFANSGNIRLEFLNSGGTLISSQTSNTITQSASTQSLSLANLAVPAGATQVRVVLQQTTSGNYWAGNYGIAFSGLQIQLYGPSSEPGGIFATLANGGSVTVQTDASLAGSGNIHVNSPVSATGSSHLTLIASNDVVLNQPISLTGNQQTLTISAQRAFVNNVGPAAIATGPESNDNRWVIYSNAPAGNAFGGLISGQLPLWGYAPGAALPSSATGNRYVFNTAPNLMLSTNDAAKTYGELFDLGTVGYSYAGFVQASTYGGVFTQETAANAVTGTPVFSSSGAAAGAAAGVYSLNADTSGISSSTGYSVTPLGSTLTVHPKDITLTGITPASKTYDATRAATITGGTFSGLVGSETLSLTGQGSFDSADAGQGKTITVADVGTLIRADGTGHWSNYRLTNTGATTGQADITPKEITLSSISVASKTYDATRAATITGGTFSGLVGSETLSLTGQGSFDSANVGQGKTVTVADVGTLTRTNGTGSWSNYRLNPSGAVTGQADITPKDVTLASITAASKTYDGSNTARITDATVSGTVNGETLSVQGQATFDSALAGTSKTVTVADPASLTRINGTGQWSNYRLQSSGPIRTTADISAPATVILPVSAVGPTTIRTSTPSAEPGAEAAGPSATSDSGTTDKETGTTALSASSQGSMAAPPTASAEVTASNSPPMTTKAAQSSLGQSTANPGQATAVKPTGKSGKVVKTGARTRTPTPAQAHASSTCSRCAGGASGREPIPIASMIASRKPFASAQERQRFEQALAQAAAAEALATVTASPSGGDPLGDSFNQSPSARNASALGRGKGQTSIEFEQQLESVNLINTLLLFVLK